MTREVDRLVENQDRATLERQAKACEHASVTDLGVKGYRPERGAYRVYGCDDCSLRWDIFDDESSESYIALRPDARKKSFAAAFERAEYRPDFDGIDAFNRWVEEQREPFFVNLFDKRGGSGGIGD